IPGVGEQKLKDFAEPFLAAIREFLGSHERKRFGMTPPPQKRAALNDSERETLRRFEAGESIDDIARSRGFVRSTICTHLALAIESGAPLTHDRFFAHEQQAEIAVAFGRTGGGNLVGLRDSLGGKYSIDELRIFRALAARAGR
ncbi:MAG TPA: helix-turn-helix domain-containing protein, partial [Chthoniobacterales bacterium]|nr:helix-turn-helix domain-containing protein [Chthoniobacterales bacterium]